MTSNGLTNRRCWVEVDLDALRANLAWIKHRVGPGVRVMTVVKADAYGHGLKSIAALLMQSGTDVFGVASLSEADSIRSVGKGWPVLLLGAALPDEIEYAIRDGVMLTLSSAEQLHQVAKVAQKLGVVASIHLKVDTGMGRLGVAPEFAPALAAEARSTPGIKLAGLYTHYASVEEEAAFTQNQRQSFRKVREAVRAAGGDPEWVHSANSAGILLELPDGCNAVRPGLLVYGVIPPGSRLGSRIKIDRFQPALSWKARVSYVKEVKAGSRLSYGGTYVVKRSSRIATVTVGYGDGYLRSGSGRAEVLIQGRRCPVVGRITMDQILVDVTRLESVNPGEEAVLIGQQGPGCIGASDVAGWMGTVPWEVLTSITYRVPRVYRGGQAS
ncbi:MAG: alanine racemase [Verrucomicrobiales bacterium]|nr:alanine racemase [Verrucomicrobiales bacterium]